MQNPINEIYQRVTGYFSEQKNRRNTADYLTKHANSLRETRKTNEQPTNYTVAGRRLIRSSKKYPLGKAKPESLETLASILY